MIGNVVAGSEKLGFYFAGTDCEDENAHMKVRDNEVRFIVSVSVCFVSILTKLRQVLKLIVVEGLLSFTLSTLRGFNFEVLFVMIQK